MSTQGAGVERGWWRKLSRVGGVSSARRALPPRSRSRSGGLLNPRGCFSVRRLGRSPLPSFGPVWHLPQKPLKRHRSQDTGPAARAPPQELGRAAGSRRLLETRRVKGQPPHPLPPWAPGGRTQPAGRLAPGPRLGKGGTAGCQGARPRRTQHLPEQAGLPCAKGPKHTKGYAAPGETFLPTPAQRPGWKGADGAWPPVYQDFRLREDHSGSWSPVGSHPPAQTASSVRELPVLREAAWEMVSYASPWAPFRCFRGHWAPPTSASFCSPHCLPTAPCAGQELGGGNAVGREGL
ncbi:uncharacterized protein [Petaurus breviceps papuanus]|uniref:uncharacterized protein n=1 Tax=Petaurus breviceps papuanus TaxID=3040969 RepID=UPI0036DD6998